MEDLDLDGMMIITCISRNRLEVCGLNRDRCLSRRTLYHRLKLVLVADIQGVAIKKPDSCSNPLLKKNQTIEVLSPSV